MKLSNEAKVGILAALAIAILIIGYNFLKGQKLFATQNTFYTFYDKIDGLLEANPVQINGFTVGIVESIELEENSDKIKVGLLIDDNIKIPEGTIAEIVSASLLGDKAVKLLRGARASTASELKSVKYLAPGDTIEGRAEVGMVDMAMAQLGPIKEQGQNLIISLDSTLKTVQGMVKSGEMDEIMDNVNKSMKNIEGVLRNVDQVSKDLSRFTGNNLDQISGQLTSTFNSVEGLTVGAKGVMNNIDGITNNLKSSLNKVDGILSSADRAAAGAAKAADGATQVMNNFGTLSSGLTTDISKVMNNFGTLSSGLNNKISKVTDDLSKMTASLSGVTNSAKAAASNVNIATKDLPGITSNFKKVSGQASALFTDLGKVTGKAAHIADNLGKVTGEVAVVAKDFGKASGKLGGITDKVGLIADNMGTMTKGISKDITKATENVRVMSEKFAKIDLNKTLEATNSTIAAAKTSIEGTGTMIKQANTMLTKATTITDNLAGMSANMDTMTRKMNGVTNTVQSMTNNMSEITAKINNGEGSAGKLINDTELYDNLTKTTGKINTLVGNLPDNPRKLLHFSIFGRKKNKDKKGQSQALTAPDPNFN